MAKVNLEMVKVIQGFAEELRQVLLSTQVALSDLGPFCDDCGETEPASGFYPMQAIISPGSVSGLICNDCERKRRDQASRPIQEG